MTFSKCQRMKYFLLLVILASCHETPSNDTSIIIPIDPTKVKVVNHTDQNGKKQGPWQDEDTINHRITKEFYFKDDLLDSSYLVYKTNSSDTLIFGYYRLGMKHGQWRYWDSTSNRLNRLEVYENDLLKETRKY